MKYSSLLLLSLLFSLADIQAQWVQLGENIVGENLGDYSGISVSLNTDGSIIAIGAFGNDGNGEDSGHVRIFENLNGTWTQIGEDIDGENYGDWSGNSVSLSFSGTIVAIGAPSNDGNGYHSGQVRIFENLNGTWTQIGEDIYGESDFDGSGESVSLSSDGTIVAIGAPTNTGSGTNAGHVRVFKYLNGTWSQIGEDIDASHSSDFFGESLSLNSDGSIVAIKGSWSTTNNTNSGQVRVYKNINGVWTQLSDSIEGDGPYFGRSISINSSGSKVGIGNYLSDNNGNSPGIVRIFENENLGISDIENKTVSIYPNPTNGIVNFNLTVKAIQKLSVSDITGKTLLMKTNVHQNETVDLSSFVNGVYIINIQIDNKIITYKIIKN